MKYVYHGSLTPNLKIIRRNKSTHMKNWVYATYSKAVATIFLSHKANDLYYYLAGSGTKSDPIILVERKKNMFKEIFNVSGSVYTLKADNFLKNRTGWSAEVISEHDEFVVEEERVNNVYNKLIELNKEKQLKLYLYPNKPKDVPEDNSDLIPKVIRWSKNGFDIKRFFELYPELREKYSEEIENK